MVPATAFPFCSCSVLLPQQQILTALAGGMEGKEQGKEENCLGLWKKGWKNKKVGGN